MKCSRQSFATLLAIAASSVSALAIAADGGDVGKREYETNCIGCHGPAGKGDGNYGQYLKVAIPDLTVLSKNNGGVFPFDRVYQAIDGRKQVKGHGSRDMPIWGTDYRTVGEAQGGNHEANVMVEGRIIALIDYLHRLQK